ncbi:MAG TPA: phosphate ABC transporter permease PstA [Fimbriimonas sp.]|nr:phosphate ABC transporter permease PstA [Fimbriimonas sp.]
MASVVGLLDQSQLTARDAKRQRASSLHLIVTYGASVAMFLLITFVIGTILVRGIPMLTWDFISQKPVEGMSAGGIWPMIRGSLLLMCGTLLMVLPIGIFGGIFLAEYAGTGRFSRMMHACVTSLAGTPSIIYGLFGLAVFVLLFHLGISLVAGWLTLTLFALPVVVLTTESAIKAVPAHHFEAAEALGLSRWQAMWRVILPQALPGIATGIVLTTGRAAGEAPPILLTAGIYYSTGELVLNAETLKQPVANLPYHLAEAYRQGGTIPEKIIWGTCLVLMLMVLSVNLVAIVVRTRIRVRQNA